MTQIIQQKCQIKGGTRAPWKHGALEMCALLGIHINSELFLFLFFEFSVQKQIAWQKSEGEGRGYSPISPHPPPHPPGAVGPDIVIFHL